MPPASWPTASIFCACRYCSSSRFWSVTSFHREKKPEVVPSTDSSGTYVIWCWRTRPSLRVTAVSKVTVSPRRTRRTQGDTDSCSGSPSSSRAGRPTISSRDIPNQLSYFLLTNTKRSSALSTAIPSGAPSVTARYCRSLASRARVAQRCSVTSVTTAMIPSGVPSAPSTGAVEMQTSSEPPSLCVRRASAWYSGEPDIVSAISLRTKTISSGAAVGRGLPMTSAARQPYSRSAPALHVRTVASGASSMIAAGAAVRSAVSRAASWAGARSCRGIIMDAVIEAPGPLVVSRPRAHARPVRERRAPLRLTSAGVRPPVTPRVRRATDPPRHRARRG